MFINTKKKKKLESRSESAKSKQWALLDVPNMHEIYRIIYNKTIMLNESKLDLEKENY